MIKLDFSDVFNSTLVILQSKGWITKPRIQIGLQQIQNTHNCIQYKIKNKKALLVQRTPREGKQYSSDGCENLEVSWKWVVYYNMMVPVTRTVSDLIFL